MSFNNNETICLRCVCKLRKKRILHYLFSSLESTILNENFIQPVAIPVVSRPRPQSKLGKAVDIVRRVMDEQHCKLMCGFVYKYIKESTSTYVCYKPVKSYIMRIMANIHVADALAGEVFSNSEIFECNFSISFLKTIGLVL